MATHDRLTAWRCGWEGKSALYSSSRSTLSGTATGWLARQHDYWIIGTRHPRHRHGWTQTRSLSVIRARADLATLPMPRRTLSRVRAPGLAGARMLTVPWPLRAASSIWR